MPLQLGNNKMHHKRKVQFLSPEERILVKERARIGVALLIAAYKIKRQDECDKLLEKMLHDETSIAHRLLLLVDDEPKKYKVLYDWMVCQNASLSRCRAFATICRKIYGFIETELDLKIFTYQLDTCLAFVATAMSKKKMTAAMIKSLTILDMRTQMEEIFKESMACAREDVLPK